MRIIPSASDVRANMINSALSASKWRSHRANGSDGLERRSGLIKGVLGSLLGAFQRNSADYGNYYGNGAGGKKRLHGNPLDFQPILTIADTTASYSDDVHAGYARRRATAA